MRLKHKITITLVIVAGILVACGENHHFKDLRDYIQSLRISKPSAKKANPPDATKVPQAANYRGAALRVPFAQQEQEVSAITPTTNPLQAYPLSVLRFVGTISREGVLIAYIAAPDGMIYQVKGGDVLGDHYGKVISITPNQMTVREQVVEAGKGPREHLVTLQLKEAR